MTTPKQLQRYADDKGLSYEQLARAVSATAGYDVTASGLWRFCKGRNKPLRKMRNAIEKFMAAQRKNGHEVAR